MDMVEDPERSPQRRHTIMRTIYQDHHGLSSHCCLTSDEEYSTVEDDCRSDISEAPSEAWVVGQSLDSDPPDIADAARWVAHECEDWDAEMEANENPYDEEEVVDLCEQPTCGYQWGSEDSYRPSSHHALSIERTPGVVSSALFVEDGQFEDAEQ